MTRVFCPYCGRDAMPVTGGELYPDEPNLKDKFFWRCTPCDAHVGCHPGPQKVPLGTLAQAPLRKLRHTAHFVFDKVWKSGSMKRGVVYQWLDTAMGMPQGEAHIGSFNRDQCLKVIQLSEAKLKELGLKIEGLK